MVKDNRYKLVLIDNDKFLNKSLKNELSLKGYNVSSFFNGLDALNYIYKNLIDLIILDIQFKDISGNLLIKKIRDHDENVPIIVLTKNFNIISKINCFDLGVNDYIVKPFVFLELLARIKKELRLLNKEEIFLNGPLKINYTQKGVFINEKEIHLTKYEYKLIYILSKNLNKTLSYQKLIDFIWGA